ncbi:flavoprotein [Streptomyces daliensis]|uniref:Flavoprotein n=1 Tax=Streptomyces daliensis TaxID=299421 RepID=A0A8T4IKB7_9ACTN|nr:flavoprotein [Streptomyces daliensis]
MTARVLHLLGSAAPPITYLPDAITLAQSDGWEVCVGLTPTAAEWAEAHIPHMETASGHPVRVVPRRLGEGAVWPPADVTILAPATLNTINTCALGLTPNVVTGVIAEVLGKRQPLVVMPCLNDAFATHPQFGRSVETLRGAGVRVLLGEGGFQPNPPGEGRPKEYPWHLALAAAHEALA